MGYWQTAKILGVKDTGRSLARLSTVKTISQNHSRFMHMHSARLARTSILGGKSLYLPLTNSIFPIYDSSWGSRYLSSSKPLHKEYNNQSAGTQEPSKSGNSENTNELETHGQPLHRFGSSIKLEQAANRFDLHQFDNDLQPTAKSYQTDLASEHHVDVYNHMTSVNLSACMQSQVPEPYGKSPTHMNMPGGVARREDKYIQGRLSDMTGKREFSTAAVPRSYNQLDEHGNITYRAAELEQLVADPCPQGIQGEDCEQFKLWLSNCLHHGNMQECEMLANEYIAGRKTLAQLFLEYDLEIQRVATSRQDGLGAQQDEPTVLKHSFNSEAMDASVKSVPEGAPVKPSRATRLKVAVRDYGSTVMVFHISMSLASLGMFYALVASNVDVMSLLAYFNISVGGAQPTVRTASTFAVAYAVHKIFAPARIAVTLTCAPLIVRALRARGILKAPKAPPSP